MDIWHYHDKTGALISAGKARRDPLTPGGYLVPAFATTVAPPEAEAGKVAVFADGAWTLVPDHRGETWWDEDGNAVVIDQPGDPAAAGLSSVAPPPPPPTLDDYRYAIQAHVDATAQERQYDSGVTCASYVNSTVTTWAAEAAAFVSWRDAVWAYAFAELAKVEANERPQPTVDDFLAELPAMVWPE